MANIDVDFVERLGVDNILVAEIIHAAVIVPSMSLNFFPFPAGPDCCCPEDVACLHRSADGEYYVASKGTQKIASN